MQGSAHSTNVPTAGRLWPYVLAATGAVVVLPLAPLAVLPAARSVPTALASIMSCMLISLLAAEIGARIWRRKTRSHELIFSDLLVWSWLNRIHGERQLQKLRRLVERAQSDPGSVATADRLRALIRMSALLESRDSYTHRHSQRVARHSAGIARELGLPRDEIARVRTAASLHDVGKICTPRVVINKPGKLTDAEFEIIKRHPGQGADMLEGLADPAIVAMVRHHHERLSGNGYPDRLSGNVIPLGARIIAVADTFDAMTSTRSYRPAMSHKRAVAILREEAGVGLDAAAVDAFLAYYSGSRGVLWSMLGTGTLGAALVAFREVVGSVAVARVVPILGAATAVSAPVVGTVTVVEAERSGLGRAAAARVAELSSAALPAAAKPVVRLSERGPTQRLSGRFVATTPGKTTKPVRSGSKVLVRAGGVRSFGKAPVAYAPATSFAPAAGVPMATAPASGAPQTVAQVGTPPGSAPPQTKQSEKDQAKADKQAQKDQAKADKQAQKDQAKADKQAQKDQAKADKQAQKDQAKADKQAQKDQAKADKQAQKDQAEADKQADRRWAGADDDDDD